jgi:hypothetical protein
MERQGVKMCGSRVLRRLACELGGSGNIGEAW